MTIANATLEDIVPLAHIINTAYRHNIEGAWTSEAHLFHEGLRVNEAALTTLLQSKNDRLFKAIDSDDTIIGTVCLTVALDYLYLGMLAVAPSTQGQGVGRQLLQHAQQIAQEERFSQIKITVITEREDLLAWYERNGYVRTNKIIPFDGDETLSKPKRTLFFEELFLPISSSEMSKPQTQPQ